MITTPQPDPGSHPSDRAVPPDPGGRSRHLVRGLAVVILVCAVVVVILMIMLHHQTQPPTPPQQPASQSCERLLPVHA